MKRLAVLLIFLITLPVFADDPAQPECDISSVDAAAQCEVGALEGLFSRDIRAQHAMVSKVANSTRATTPPDAFAARIHNSYQDFLVPLSFAINKVEESKDGQALTLRFNPLRQPPWNAGLTATVSKPSVADSVKNAIGVTSRDTTVSAIQKELGDFDDVTVALSITRTTDECKQLDNRCFGRNPRIYWNLISGPVLALAPQTSAEAAQTATSELFDEVLIGEIERAQHVSLANRKTKEDKEKRSKFLNKASRTKLADFSSDPDVRRRIYEGAKKAGELDAADTKAYLAALKTRGIDNLSTLIDNQPEFALTGIYHNLGRFSGPDQVSGSVDFQVGLYHLTNVKRLVPGCGDDKECLTRALALPGLSSNLSDKFVFNVTYTKTDRYKLDSLGDIDSSAFTPIDLKRASEWKGKAQWGRKLGMLVKDERPRVDVSAEFHRTSADGVRTLNRFVATTTLTVPWGATASIPVSLAYANKSQFLNDSRKQLSMHFGLSYRFPWEQQQ
ncbi:MAG TPA: hypothetical protein VHU41_13880 [Thermoanaerobaculia bacterium]|nr:hypothetical protein [Thermoanaerobaculia bacterium]